jgi:hypothetical protein
VAQPLVLTQEEGSPAGSEVTAHSSQKEMVNRTTTRSAKDLPSILDLSFEHSTLTTSGRVIFIDDDFVVRVSFA